MADLGSGGGFPGIPFAIMAKAEGRQIDIVLVESDHRKAVFLECVGRELGLNFVVIADRIAEIPPLKTDVLTARALAPLDKLLGYAALHLAPGGIAIFPKGERAEQELELAKKRWEFTLNATRSITEPQARTFVFSDIRNAG